MAKRIFNTEIKNLIKVKNSVSNSQTMNGTTVTLFGANKGLLKAAEDKIIEAINLLDAIE